MSSASLRYPIVNALTRTRQGRDSLVSSKLLTSIANSNFSTTRRTSRTPQLPQDLPKKYIKEVANYIIERGPVAPDTSKTALTAKQKQYRTFESAFKEYSVASQDELRKQTARVQRVTGMTKEETIKEFSLQFVSDTFAKNSRSYFRNSAIIMISMGALIGVWQSSKWLLGSEETYDVGPRRGESGRPQMDTAV